MELLELLAKEELASLSREDSRCSFPSSLKKGLQPYFLRV